MAFARTANLPQVKIEHVLQKFEELLLYDGTYRHLIEYARAQEADPTVYRQRIQRIEQLLSFYNAVGKPKDLLSLGITKSEKFTKLLDFARMASFKAKDLLE